MTIYIIDAAILIAAIYLIIVGIIMKKTGKIPASVMGEEMKKNCRDEKEFSNELFPWMMMFGIFSVIAAIIGFVLDRFSISFANYIVCGIFILVFILFSIMYRRAVKKYFTEM